MELRHLRYFVAVAEAGSVSRAAARLHLTQPALSRRIRDLERDLGVELFDRIGRRIELTAQGEDLLHRSRDLLAGAEALADRARALVTGDAGILRLGATPQMLESVLADFLAHHRRAHPATEVHLLEDGGLELLRRLERGDIHLAVSIPGDGMHHRTLFPARILAVMAPAHRLARRPVLELTALEGEPLLLLRREFGSRQWFDGACQVAHLRPRVVLESGSAHTLAALARTGHGIAVLPSTVRHGDGIRVTPLLQGGRALGRWLAVNWDPRRFLPAYARTFVDELEAHTRRTYPGKAFERVAPVPRRREQP
jgi:DNA-binding transcriptional LysR family regulator